MSKPQKAQPETQPVLWTKQWNSNLFSFAIERPNGFIFESGQFVMIGLPGENEGDKPVMRAYSIASPSMAEHLEFLSIAVPDGPLTSRLVNIKEGDGIILGKKPVGTLVQSALLPGKNLFLYGTGTGLAPWMSIVRDPMIYGFNLETYEFDEPKFDKIILCHGVRHTEDLAYREYLEKEIFEDEYIGEAARKHLIYYPAVTRDPTFKTQGRLTELTESGKLFADLGLNQTQFNPEDDRVMICGNTAMNSDMMAICKAHGLTMGSNSRPGDFVYETAFVERDPDPKPAPPDFNAIAFEI